MTKAGEPLKTSVCRAFLCCFGSCVVFTADANWLKGLIFATMLLRSVCIDQCIKSKSNKPRTRGCNESVRGESWCIYKYIYCALVTLERRPSWPQRLTSSLQQARPPRRQQWHQRERKYRRAQRGYSLLIAVSILSPSTLLQPSLTIMLSHKDVGGGGSIKQETSGIRVLFSTLCLHSSQTISFLFLLPSPPSRPPSSVHWQRTQPWAELIKCF